MMSLFVLFCLTTSQINVLDLTLEQKQAMLDKHNEYRKSCANGEMTINGPLYSSNMVYLFWDQGLEDMARQRASYCYFGHFGGSQRIQDDWNNYKENMSFFEPRSGYIVGENVAIYPQNPPINNYSDEIYTSGIDGWAREGELYDWPNNICYADTCGHWGQVCSGPTRYVGCAMVECYNGIAGATLDIYKNGGMILVCNYYPSVDQGNYPFEDGLHYDFCIRCQQWDVKICENNVCKGGKARDWLASGLINSTIDQCTDGLNRIMDPCTTIDPTKAPTQGLSSAPTIVTNSPITRSPTTSKQPTPRPTLYGFYYPSNSPTKTPTISPIVSNTQSSQAMLGIIISAFAVIVTGLIILSLCLCIKARQARIKREIRIASQLSDDPVNLESNSPGKKKKNSKKYKPIKEGDVDADDMDDMDDIILTENDTNKKPNKINKLPNIAELYDDDDELKTDQL